MAAPNSYFASAPFVVPQSQPDPFFSGLYAETPNQPGQYFTSSHYAGAPGIRQTPNGTAAPHGSNPPAPGSLAGRKRSRGDVFAEDEEEEDLKDGSVTTPIDGQVSKPRGKPMYGPGMTLIYPEDPGYAAAAESQSGTWVEEQAARKPFELGHAKRPSVSSRKSLRKDASASGQDELAHLLLPPQIREATAEPLIDEATRALGISWTLMDSTEALRINKAAYAKFIEHYYPGLKDVVVWFENSALPGYLVEARNVYSSQQGFYIFSHDLTEARLVTTEAAQLLPRLRLLPALHLAAPGGHIRAETDPITAAQNETNGLQAAAVEDGMSRFSHEVSQLRGQVQVQDEVHSYGVVAPQPVDANGMCAAPEMELD